MASEEKTYLSGGDETRAELFQILKDDAAKVLHSICQQSEKTQQWPHAQASVVAACGLSSCSSWALEHRLSNCGA